MARILAEYNQQPSEDILDWKYRLVFGKFNKDIKLSWNEISLLLGLGCSGEYLRKIAYGVQEYAGHIESKCRHTVTSNAEVRIGELEMKRFQMEREKMRMQDQKRELNKLLREYARTEHIKAEFQAAVLELAKSRPLTLNSKPLANGTREAALLLSDWHKGQHSAHHWNTYNDAVFKQRIDSLVSKAIAYGHENKVRCMHVFALGDLINGLIHVTTRINNTENSIRQVMAVSEILTAVLVKLASEFEEVKAYFSRGNHDRVSANIKESIASESFFDVIPWYLEARLKDIPNIKLIENDYDDEIIVTEICNQTIFAVHGNRDKVNSVVQNLSLMIKKFPDFVFMAHYHHSVEDEIHGCDVVVNSALCGTDTFAKTSDVLPRLARSSSYSIKKKAGFVLITLKYLRGKPCTS